MRSDLPFTFADEPVAPDSLEPRDGDEVLSDFMAAEDGGELYSIFEERTSRLLIPLGFLRARNRSIARTLARVQWGNLTFQCLTRAETIVGLSRSNVFEFAKPL